MCRLQNNKGIALVISVGLIAFVGIIAIAFAFKMQFELRSTINYQRALQSRYIAESGIAHAKEILDKDKQANNFDAYSDEMAHFI